MEENQKEMRISAGNTIAIVQKSPLLINFSDIAGNVLLADEPNLPMAWNGQRVRAWKKMPPEENYYGLGDKAGEVSGFLSHGNQKQLELGIALASEPDLLLLDEPTAGMSATETRETIRLIERITRERGLTLLFTEHDMEVVFSIAQRISVLHQGRLIAEGTPSEVRNDPEVRRVYLGERRR